MAPVKRYTNAEHNLFPTITNSGNAIEAFPNVAKPGPNWTAFGRFRLTSPRSLVCGGFGGSIMPCMGQRGDGTIMFWNDWHPNWRAHVLPIIPMCKSIDYNRCPFSLAELLFQGHLI